VTVDPSLSCRRGRIGARSHNVFDKDWTTQYIRSNILCESVYGSLQRPNFLCGQSVDSLDLSRQATQLLKRGPTLIFPDAHFQLLFPIETLMGGSFFDGLRGSSSVLFPLPTPTGNNNGLMKSKERESPTAAKRLRINHPP
jgi:hypothetical protein